MPRSTQRRVFTKTRGERLFSSEESSRLQAPHLELVPPVKMYINTHEKPSVLELAQYRELKVSHRLVTSEPRRRGKVNAAVHRAQEKTAAIMVQAWWRGILTRKKTVLYRIDRKIEEADNAAKIALGEAEKLRKFKEEIHSIARTEHTIPIIQM